MTKSVEIVRKVLAVIVSLPLFVLGLILIPLPGPGLLIMLLALVVLSSGFDRAKIYRDKVLNQIKTIFTQAKDKDQS